jgi:Na+/melibiose symporter-like transporter
MIACIMILPLAFIAGYIREIPAGWTLIDCLFGILGIIPLWICYQKIKKLEML